MIVNNRIQCELESLLLLSASDFSACAIREARGTRVRWIWASGNRNERYKRMTLKMGVGPAGLAMRIGRPINWDDSVSSYVGGSECPLIIAEQLRCAAAFPILLERGIDAVLLMARRTSLRYTDHELAVIGEAVKALAPLFAE